MEDIEIYEDKRKIAKWFWLNLFCTIGLYLLHVFVVPYALEILIFLPITALGTLLFVFKLVIQGSLLARISPQGIQRFRLIGNKYFPWSEVGNILITNDGDSTQVRVQSRVKDDFIELDERFLPGTAEEMRTIIIEYQKAFATVQPTTAQQQNPIA